MINEEKIKEKLHRVFLHQQKDNLSFWYGEANKKEIILDEVRKLVINENEGKLGEINHLVNDFIFKGITTK